MFTFIYDTAELSHPLRQRGSRDISRKPFTDEVVQRWGEVLRYYSALANRSKRTAIMSWDAWCEQALSFKGKKVGSGAGIYCKQGGTPWGEKPSTFHVSWVGIVGGCETSWIAVCPPCWTVLLGSKNFTCLSPCLPWRNHLLKCSISGLYGVCLKYSPSWLFSKNFLNLKI